MSSLPHPAISQWGWVEGGEPVGVEVREAEASVNTAVEKTKQARAPLDEETLLEPFDEFLGNIAANVNRNLQNVIVCCISA